jgi:hypothetical protein
MVAIEAMASGTPVLASGGGALPELIRHGTTGYLTDTFDELTAYINDDAIAALKRADCRRTVAERFSADSIASRLLGLYRSVLKPKAAPVSKSIAAGLRTARHTSEAFYEHLPAATESPAKPEL